MDNFNEFKKERKIFTLDELRTKNTGFKKLMADGRIPCMFKDGVFIKLEKIRSAKSFPKYINAHVYFLTEQEFDIFANLKSQIVKFKNTIDETFRSMLITFMQGEFSDFRELSDILGRITNMGDDTKAPDWIDHAHDQ